MLHEKLKMELLIAIVLVSLLIAFLLFNYVFSIYESEIHVSNYRLNADGNSTTEIIVSPLNALGFAPPFRSSPATFVIEDGKDLAEIVLLDEENGRMILRAGYQPGKVIITVKPKLALLPTSLEIFIETPST